MFTAQHKERRGDMTRQELKAELARHDLRQWQIAEFLEISEATVSKMLRRPTDESSDRIMSAITKLASK